jgi:glycosyltransferase involved in cell wall biosynthesis
MKHAELPTVSVIVPTFNRRDRLPRVIDALLEDDAATEVIVVVDGCRDGSLELVTARAATQPRLRPLFIENRGTAGAHQAGVEHAVGDIVLLLADDIIAGPRLVTGHARLHMNREDLVVVGYMPIRHPSRRPDERCASLLYMREYEQACTRYEEDADSILRGLWGGNVSLRRARCLEVGVENRQFRARYHEDQEFGLRCLKSGLVGMFDRSLAAEHAHARSLKAFLRDSREQGKGKVLVRQAHGDVLGPFDPWTFEADLPAPVRAVVRLARRPRMRAVLTASLQLLTAAAGTLRVMPLQLRGVQLLRRIELERGALSAQRLV